MIEKFWVVYNPQREKPKIQHKSEQLAVDEAKRLAKFNQEEKFYVLECKCVCYTQKVVVEEAFELPF